MKNLITAAAGLMLLLAFLLQFTHSQLLHSRLLEADRQVYTFRETVRQRGCMTKESEENLQKELAEIFRCSEDEVSAECSRAPAFRGEIIEYKISVPAKNIIADGGFWNIEDEKNQFTYEKKGGCISEYTGRESIDGL